MMPRHELMNIAEVRLRLAHIAETEILCEKRFFKFCRNGRMLQERFDFRGEREEPAVPIVVEGLDPQPVPGTEEGPLRHVPKSEREHPSEEGHATGAVLLVAV